MLWTWTLASWCHLFLKFKNILEIKALQNRRQVMTPCGTNKASPCTFTAMIANWGQVFGFQEPPTMSKA
jgi:hypothetical protein